MTVELKQFRGDMLEALDSILALFGQFRSSSASGRNAKLLRKIELSPFVVGFSRECAFNASAKEKHYHLAQAISHIAVSFAANMIVAELSGSS